MVGHLPLGLEVLLADSTHEHGDLRFAVTTAFPFAFAVLPSSPATMRLQQACRKRQQGETPAHVGQHLHEGGVAGKTEVCRSNRELLSNLPPSTADIEMQTSTLYAVAATLHTKYMRYAT